MFTTFPIDAVKPSSYRKFSCNVPELDTYLKRYAHTNHKKGIGKSFLLLQDTIVVGFYTISMAHIEFTHAPDSMKSGLPKYPIPVARIGRLAVDDKYQGQKLGKLLLMDALKRIYEASRSVAAYAILVDAKTADVKKFYERFGFIPFQLDSVSLYLPMKTLQILYDRSR